MRKTSTLSKINPEVRVKKTSYLIAKTFFASLFIAAIVFAGCKKDDFEGEIVGVCPVVTTDPADKAVNVVINKVITATFNTNMDPETINASSFIIKQGTQEIEGTVAPTADAAVYTFTPKVALSPFTTYTGTITKASRDVLHTAMVEDYVWTFTTIPLISLSASPVAGGTTAGEGFIAQDSVAAITATPNTGYTFTSWTENGTVVSTSPSLTFAMDGNKSLVANFTPVVIGRFAVVLSSNPAIGGSTLGSGSYETGSVVTIAAVANFGYSFVNWTGDERGTTSSLSFTIGSNKNIVANFKLDPTNTTPVPPITTNPPTTPTQPPVGTAPKGPANINLGSAGDFTILTKAGISTTGVTSVGGDIGVSPAAATSITGFGLIMDSNNQSSHTPAVTGKVYAADYAAPTPAKMTTAVKDMETAFTTANGLTTPAPIVGLYSGNISGRVLAPGLYKWASGVLITNAGVTLAGGPNDTWVFQISQDLTVNSSAIVTLIGGAQAKNITWVVSGQATLGTNANFSGTILSKTLISLNTGAVVKGRLLAQTAVTLNASTVTKP
ncbi:hypothetical protein GCM10011387_15260 [Pedobacter quisquiliarum]|uniref:Listeria/Bacterioides repeat-containing protein n=1 Tax=Pedobacter quisquiliarum TaxID=1834438 RepID=A0A916U6J7_9SPHI|nr:ice-binding family protein [Pedobacter quisquiliarum]GGC62607.1 hypothetical protein GCM10011387_15260 [Pedobacter quisquiliarum]